MIKFDELKSFPSDIRRFYESFIRDGERIESNVMAELVRDGYVRLFASQRDGHFVMANFIAVAPMYASKIMLQSYMIIDENKIDFEGQSEHMQAMLSKLNADYPGARLLFEAYKLGEFQGMLKHEKPRCIWPTYKMPDLNTGKFLDAELWAYPVGVDDNGTISDQQIAEWVYVLQRVCYEADVKAAARVVTACGLPSDRIAFFERAVSAQH
jgi:hypothetical protein